MTVRHLSLRRRAPGLPAAAVFLHEPIRCHLRRHSVHILSVPQHSKMARRRALTADEHLATCHGGGTRTRRGSPARLRLSTASNQMKSLCKVLRVLLSFGMRGRKIDIDSGYVIAREHLPNREVLQPTPARCTPGTTYIIPGRLPGVSCLVEVFLSVTWNCPAPNPSSFQSASSALPRPPPSRHSAAAVQLVSRCHFFRRNAC